MVESYEIDICAGGKHADEDELKSIIEKALFEKGIVLLGFEWKRTIRDKVAYDDWSKKSRN